MSKDEFMYDHNMHMVEDLNHRQLSLSGNDGQEVKKRS